MITRTSPNGFAVTLSSDGRVALSAPTKRPVSDIDCRPAPYVGQPVSVRGCSCRVIAVRPAGTIDVESQDGRRWRLSGLAFTTRSIPGNRTYLRTPPGMLRHFAPADRERLRTPQPVTPLFTEIATRLLFVQDASGNVFPTQPVNVIEFARLTTRERRAIVEQAANDRRVA